MWNLLFFFLLGVSLTLFITSNLMEINFLWLWKTDHGLWLRRRCMGSCKSITSGHLHFFLNLLIWLTPVQAIGDWFDWEIMCFGVVDGLLWWSLALIYHAKAFSDSKPWMWYLKNLIQGILPQVSRDVFDWKMEASLIDELLRSVDPSHKKQKNRWMAGIWGDHEDPKNWPSYTKKGNQAWGGGPWILFFFFVKFH